MSFNVLVRRAARVAALATLTGALCVRAPAALAQRPSNLAASQGEAPGGAPLAPAPFGTGLSRTETAALQTAQTEPTTPAAPPDGERAGGPSMAFASDAQECRETVPGGPMLAIAYAVVLVVLGVYVALLARKNAQLATQIEELEAQIARAVAPHEDA